MFSGISLKIANLSIDQKGYPTSQLQKGIILVYNDQELAEEGVGFGVPVLKEGLRTIFPGDIELIPSSQPPLQEIAATYTLNLEERLTSQYLGIVNSKTLYAMKNLLAELYRRMTPLRGPLIVVSNTLRRFFGWETTYERMERDIKVKTIYAIDSQAGIIHVNVDASDLLEGGITEAVVMNEQGGGHFDLYQDSSGAFLQGDEIGSWDEVTADEASFISKASRLAFTLRRIKGARLFRGRELVGKRLAWSGFGYSFHPGIGRIDYQLKIERLP